MKTKRPDCSGSPYLTACMVVVLSTASFAQTNYERTKIAPPPSAENAYFTWQVAISGNRVLCSNVTYRHDVQFASPTGSAVFEGLGQHAAPGSTLLYQCWYRDPQSTCGLGGSNLTNGWAVTW